MSDNNSTPKEDRTVCFCFNVTESTIRAAIKEGELEQIEDVTDACKAGGGCSTCHPDIEEILEDINS